MLPRIASLWLVPAVLLLCACSSGEGGGGKDAPATSTSATTQATCPAASAHPGSLDTTFNATGIVSNFGAAGYAAGLEAARAVAIDGQGRMVVVGLAQDNTINQSTNMLVLRYLPSGALDTSFGSGGHFTITGTAGAPAAQAADLGAAVAIDGAGRIVVAGSSAVDGTSSAATVWRLTDQGALDTTFNAPKVYVVLGPMVLSTFSSEQDDFSAIAFDSAGNYLLAGQASDGVSVYTALVKMSPDGILDPAFGTAGVFKTIGAAGGTLDHAVAIAVDSTNSSYLAGTSNDVSGNTYAVVWKVLADGTALDPAFGTAGSFSRAGTAGGTNPKFDFANGIVVDPTGRILAAGMSNSNNVTGSPYLVVWALTSSGAPDPSFGTNGVFLTAGPSDANAPTDFGNALRIDCTGDLVVAGTSFVGNGLLTAVWRITPAGVPDTSFNGGGSVALPVASPTAPGTTDDEGNALAIDAAGDIVVVGSTRDAVGAGGAALWRILP